MAAGDDKQLLDVAARLALRALGDVEPNPMVGAVIVKNDRVIGLGHHRRYGGLHAEREALADCRRRGEDPRGASVYVTLEPCCHHGKQPPCTDALIEAGVARVVAARPDPNPVSSGGRAVLERAGIPCEFSGASPLAISVSDAFVRGIVNRIPWVVAKWAQTPDGRLATHSHEPRWISGEVSRRRVHRLRARVDAVMTGIGTVAADDPLLTARGVRVRRIAQRIVLDPGLEVPLGSAIVRTAREGPVVVLCSHEAASRSAHRSALERLNVVVMPVEGSVAQLDLQPALARLFADQGVQTVLLESGPRLLSAMFAAGLIDAAMVHVPGVAASEAPAAAVRVAPALGTQFELCRQRRRGPDQELLYRGVTASRT